jgi:hypothetical protein
MSSTSKVVSTLDDPWQELKDELLQIEKSAHPSKERTDASRVLTVSAQSASISSSTSDTKLQTQLVPSIPLNPLEAPTTRKSIPEQSAIGQFVHSVPPRLSTLAHETEVRTAFEKATGKTFKKVRPRFLRNPDSGRNLELDGFCEELQLAFEYDGQAHSCFPNAFHRTKEQFEAQQKRDVLKDQLCKRAGVHLIRISHTIPFDEIETHVLKCCSSSIQY